MREMQRVGKAAGKTLQLHRATSLRFGSQAFDGAAARVDVGEDQQDDHADERQADQDARHRSRDARRTRHQNDCPKPI